MPLTNIISIFFFGDGILFQNTTKERENIRVIITNEENNV